MTKLYHLSNRELTTIDRYEVGKELNLPKEETDAIVDELSNRGMITTMAGRTIMLTPDEKKILDTEWHRVNE
ncbi:MAG TPA: hypothetical protein VJS91_09740 [Nitrososphaeraceae archaeon]|nr:hypothetical protein [Nitrososphaeraceae archaeon]